MAFQVDSLSITLLEINWKYLLLGMLIKIGTPSYMEFEYPMVNTRILAKCMCLKIVIAQTYMVNLVTLHT